jgi:Flp pilus assembly protein TadG
MIILAAFFMVIGLSFAAIVIDMGRFMHGRQEVQNAVDAAALAAAQDLPNDATSAQTKANEYLADNDPHGRLSDQSVTFRCIVGDRNHDGQPDSGDVPAACDPGSHAFTCNSSTGLCSAMCDPSQGNKCNTVVVGASEDVPFLIAPIFDMFHASTGTIRAAACRGACGGPPTGPVDLLILIDRTSSMSSADVTNARNAANAILGLYNPAQQWVGLGLLGRSSTTSTCSGSPAVNVIAAATKTPTSNWVPIGLSGTGNATATPPGYNEAYVNASKTPIPSSHLEKGISCFDTSSTGTDLASPVAAAAAYLQTHGRPNAVKGIILETDGSPNGSTCLDAYNAAQSAKTGSPSIEIFTIGFGLTDSDKCPDTSGAYKGKSVVQLLADMATSSDNNGCVDAENTDGDHFFCLPKTSQLASIFQIAAAQLATGARLIQLPD